MILKMFKVGREFLEIKKAHNVTLHLILEEEEDKDLGEDSSEGEVSLEDVAGHSHKVMQAVNRRVMEASNRRVIKTYNIMLVRNMDISRQIVSTEIDVQMQELTW